MKMSKMAPVIGNTYPVKDQIKALGGKFDGVMKLWLVPVEKLAQAQALVKSTPKSGGNSRMAREENHWDTVGTFYTGR
jgi:hypothetical protein